MKAFQFRLIYKILCQIYTSCRREQLGMISCPCTLNRNHSSRSLFKKDRADGYILFVLNVTGFMLCSKRYYFCFSKCLDIWVTGNKSFSRCVVSWESLHPSCQFISGAEGKSYFCSFWIYCHSFQEFWALECCVWGRGVGQSGALIISWGLILTVLPFGDTILEIEEMALPSLLYRLCLYSHGRQNHTHTFRWRGPAPAIMRLVFRSNLL